MNVKKMLGIVEVGDVTSITDGELLNLFERAVKMDTALSCSGKLRGNTDARFRLKTEIFRRMMGIGQGRGETDKAQELWIENSIEEGKRARTGSPRSTVESE